MISPPQINHECQTPGGPDDISIIVQDENSPEKVCVTLSSGEDVDVSSLPVRVAPLDGDLPMQTPKHPQEISYDEPAMRCSAYSPTEM